MQRSLSQRLSYSNKNASIRTSIVSPRLSSQSSTAAASAVFNLEDVNMKTWILSTSEIDNVVYYRILTRRGPTNVIKETKRRYTDFLAFRDSLLDLFEVLPTCPRCINIAKVLKDWEFPRKHFFSSKAKVVVNYRMQAFRNFLALIVSKVFNASPKCPTCGGQVVTIVLRFLLQNATILPENQIHHLYNRESMTSTLKSIMSPISSSSKATHVFNGNVRFSTSTSANFMPKSLPSGRTRQTLTVSSSAVPKQQPLQQQEGKRAGTTKASSFSEQRHRFSKMPQEDNDDYVDLEGSIVVPRKKNHHRLPRDNPFLDDKDNVPEVQKHKLLQHNDDTKEATVQQQREPEKEVEPTAVAVHEKTRQMNEENPLSSDGGGSSEEDEDDEIDTRGVFMGHE
jgi:hypothetical protein